MTDPFERCEREGIGYTLSHYPETYKDAPYLVTMAAWTRDRFGSVYRPVGTSGATPCEAMRSALADRDATMKTISVSEGGE